MLFGQNPFINRKSRLIFNACKISSLVTLILRTNFETCQSMRQFSGEKWDTLRAMQQHRRRMMSVTATTSAAAAEPIGIDAAVELELQPPP